MFEECDPRLQSADLAVHAIKKAIFFGDDEIFELDTPGMVNNVMTNFGFARLTRPAYPLDSDTNGGCRANLPRRSQKNECNCNNIGIQGAGSIFPWPYCQQNAVYGGSDRAGCCRQRHGRGTNQASTGQVSRHR